MAHVSRFKSEQYRERGYAAAHLAGAVEMLLEEAEHLSPSAVVQPLRSEAWP